MVQPPLAGVACLLAKRVREDISHKNVTNRAEFFIRSNLLLVYSSAIGDISEC